MDYGKKSAHPHKAMVTDYDCWKENEEVNVENVMKQMKENIRNFVSKTVRIARPSNFEIFEKAKCNLDA